MKHWAARLFIAGYLGVLSFGLLCHTFQTGTGMHSVMYFIVWDMFCGWNAYAGDTHIVAEGVSGEFYEVAPLPWGELVPYGSMPRHDYDVYLNHLPRLAKSVLDHTDHEPIARVFVIEENWAKMYDLPDVIWQQRYGAPKDRTRYYRMRLEMAGDCSLLHRHVSWVDAQANAMLMENPRLRQESRSGQPFFMVDQAAGSGYLNNRSSFNSVSAPVGN